MKGFKYRRGYVCSIKEEGAPLDLKCKPMLWDPNIRPLVKILVLLLLYSIISTNDTKFMAMNMKNFHLVSPMERYECVRLKMSDIPAEIIE